VLTQDVNRLELEDARYDRVVSIEMFEHMRNYETLLGRIARWLQPGGKLFVHIFCHRELLYPFETEGEHDWMGRHFFTGGLMPSFDTLACFQRDLRSGATVAGTRHALPEDRERLAREPGRAPRQVLGVLREAYGAEAKLWFQRWRMFWMACAELFGYRGGDEWLVGHYRFVK
jgi:cyclopropane-fatty-acyl-phospholipid synthase